MNMNILRKLNFKIFAALYISLLCSALILFSCSRHKDDDVSVIKIPEISSRTQYDTHKWFYFTNGGFVQVHKISEIPYHNLVPWTEAVRISSANSLATLGSHKAFAVVNRLGILSFNDEEISLSGDSNIFKDRTAGNLIFLNEVPIFSVFKSSFFNATIKDENYSNPDTQHLFLVQFDPVSHISYPIINCNNLIKLPDSEVVDYYWDGINWTCCIKTISEVKTDFSYINWKPGPSLLTLSPVNANSNITVWESSKDEFRAKKEQYDFALSPDRIKKMLAAISHKANFVICLKNSGGSSPRYYKNTCSNENLRELIANAIIAQTWSAALFEDGTLYLEGALPGHHILRAGKPVALRLPKLPENFVYYDFVISGDTLYAAWEETAFFQTGRSGFVEINLNKTLYSKL